MNLGVIIPTRGDRPKMLDHAFAMLSRQTIMADRVFLIDDPPRSPEIDVGWRYRLGLERAKNAGMTHVTIWEDDDWYRENYLEKARDLAIDGGLSGFCDTWFYHLETLRTWHLTHPRQCSGHAMTLAVEPFLSKYPWPEQGREPKSVDARISKWCLREGVPTNLLHCYDPLVISMKGHNSGMRVGNWHRKDWDKWNGSDPGMVWLRSQIKNDDDFEFYRRIHERVS